ncbi:hypothetical protein [Anaerotignum sp. MB30-C6]|uniref:hypothetical protein n=1 Tax=Anaerotignum sp. MB30-C6 TaxID=3070814 RepID=UPI0027DD05E6|nr:hypothetical protein [Anaerotignum sp. MB30-C6]WMI82081.1 hypothetical protein RBQ60_04930 [Anaerotignum sp. MB30-C6]
MKILYGESLIGKKYEYGSEIEMLQKANELKKLGYAVKRAVGRGRYMFPLYIVIVIGYKE